MEDIHPTAQPIEIRTEIEIPEPDFSDDGTILWAQFDSLEGRPEPQLEFLQRVIQVNPEQVQEWLRNKHRHLRKLWITHFGTMVRRVGDRWLTTGNYEQDVTELFQDTMPVNLVGFDVSGSMKLGNGNVKKTMPQMVRLLAQMASATQLKLFQPVGLCLNPRDPTLRTHAVSQAILKELKEALLAGAVELPTASRRFIDLCEQRHLPSTTACSPLAFQELLGELVSFPRGKVTFQCATYSHLLQNMISLLDQLSLDLAGGVKLDLTLFTDGAFNDLTKGEVMPSLIEFLCQEHPSLEGQVVKVVFAPNADPMIMTQLAEQCQTAFQHQPLEVTIVEDLTWTGRGCSLDELPLDIVRWIYRVTRAMVFAGANDSQSIVPPTNRHGPTAYQRASGIFARPVCQEHLVEIFQLAAQFASWVVEEWRQSQVVPEGDDDADAGEADLSGGKIEEEDELEEEWEAPEAIPDPDAFGHLTYRLPVILAVCLAGKAATRAQDATTDSTRRLELLKQLWTELKPMEIAPTLPPHLKTATMTPRQEFDKLLRLQFRYCQQGKLPAGSPWFQIMARLKTELSLVREGETPLAVDALMEELMPVTIPTESSSGRQFMPGHILLSHDSYQLTPCGKPTFRETCIRVEEMLKDMTFGYWVFGEIRRIIQDAEQLAVQLESEARPLLGYVQAMRRISNLTAERGEAGERLRLLQAEAKQTDQLIGQLMRDPTCPSVPLLEEMRNLLQENPEEVERLTQFMMSKGGDLYITVQPKMSMQHYKSALFNPTSPGQLQKAMECLEIADEPPTKGAYLRLNLDDPDSCRLVLRLLPSLRAPNLLTTRKACLNSIFLMFCRPTTEETPGVPRCLIRAAEKVLATYWKPLYLDYQEVPGKPGRWYDVDVIPEEMWLYAGYMGQLPDFNLLPDDTQLENPYVVTARRRVERLVRMMHQRSIIRSPLPVDLTEFTETTEETREAERVRQEQITHCQEAIVQASTERDEMNAQITKLEGRLRFHQQELTQMLSQRSVCVVTEAQKERVRELMGGIDLTSWPELPQESYYARTCGSQEVVGVPISICLAGGKYQHKDSPDDRPAGARIYLLKDHQIVRHLSPTGPSEAEIKECLMSEESQKALKEYLRARFDEVGLGEKELEMLRNLGGGYYPVVLNYPRDATFLSGYRYLMFTGDSLIPTLSHLVREMMAQQGKTEDPARALRESMAELQGQLETQLSRREELLRFLQERETEMAELCPPEPTLITLAQFAGLPLGLTTGLFRWTPTEYRVAHGLEIPEVGTPTDWDTVPTGQSQKMSLSWDIEPHLTAICQEKVNVLPSGFSFTLPAPLKTANGYLTELTVGSPEWEELQLALIKWASSQLVRGRPSLEGEDFDTCWICSRSILTSSPLWEAKRRLGAQNCTTCDAQHFATCFERFWFKPLTDPMTRAPLGLLAGRRNPRLEYPLPASICGPLGWPVGTVTYNDLVALVELPPPEGFLYMPDRVAEVFKCPPEASLTVAWGQCWAKMKDRAFTDHLAFCSSQECWRRWIPFPVAHECAPADEEEVYAPPCPACQELNADQDIHSFRCPGSYLLGRVVTDVVEGKEVERVEQPTDRVQRELCGRLGLNRGAVRRQKPCRCGDISLGDGCNNITLRCTRGLNRMLAACAICGENRKGPDALIEDHDYYHFRPDFFGHQCAYSERERGLDFVPPPEVTEEVKDPNLVLGFLVSRIGSTEREHWLQGELTLSAVKTATKYSSSSYSARPPHPRPAMAGAPAGV